MSRRIEIEITSLSGEVATWRAAGAKLPKGVLNAALVPGGAVVGNVYRADVEQYMEGMEVLSVMAPKTASPLDPHHERIERIPSAKQGPDVVVTYAPKGRGGSRREGGRDGDRDTRSPRREGGPGRRDGSASRPDRPDRAERSAPRRDESVSSSGAESTSPERAKRPSARPTGGRERHGAPSAERGARPGRPGRPERSGPPGQPPMTTTHRNALLATLSPEQLPVAEQLLRGGMPSVRTAVAEQNKNAVAQGRPTIDPATIERIAEDLLGKTNVALWKDRAAGAIGAGRELRLRDLRAVVTSAKTVSLDEEARAQLKELQVALTARLEHLRTQWNERLESAVASKNVTEALSLVARPPDMSTRVSADMAVKVVAVVSEVLTAEQDPTLWKQVVALAVETSIRRNIKPTGIPDDESCKAVAIHNAGAIPELAKLLGMRVPPPPPPTQAHRRTVTRRAS
ncbi:MAG: hypothetical protein HKL86_10065 [Acidimicrobiaceae bacterium]|nr:hypothetical protein [Acidimicrobiaceae bacterium]